jgi:hypothetical protein
MQRLFPGMMENVRFPEAQQNLSLKLFHKRVFDNRYWQSLLVGRKGVKLIDLRLWLEVQS